VSALFWYNCLAVIGVGSAAFALYNKRNLTELSTWFVFFLFATSITWLSEFTVLGLFDSYAYKPGVFANPWAENIVGHLILNSTLWPGTAVAVVAYRLGYGWIAIITAAFLTVEYLFIRAGFYEQHWWRYYMTATALILFLLISKAWFPLMNERRYGLIRFVTMFFAAFVIIHLPIPLLLLYGKQYYSAALAEDIYRSSTIFILLYNLVEAAVVMFFLFLDKWFWKLASFGIAFGGHIFLAAGNILIVQDGWRLEYTLLIYAITLTGCIFMEKYALRPPGGSRRPGRG
jgi:hypothetical protein